MAERQIVIRIINDSNQDKAPSPDANSSKNEGASADAEEKKSQEKGIFAFYLTSNALSILKSGMVAGYSRNIDLSEDYVSQQASSNMGAWVSMFAATSSSIMVGAKTGFAAFGPTGAAVGAALGAGAGLIFGTSRNILTSANNIAQQSRALHEQAYSLYFNTERAGMVNYSRGTEN